MLFSYVCCHMTNMLVIRQIFDVDHQTNYHITLLQAIYYRNINFLFTSALLKAPAQLQPALGACITHSESAFLVPRDRKVSLCYIGWVLVSNVSILYWKLSQFLRSETSILLRVRPRTPFINLARRARWEKWLAKVLTASCFKVV